jgi:hypothetical protein
MKTIIKIINAKIAIIAIAILTCISNLSFGQIIEESLMQTFTGFDTSKTYNQKAALVPQFKLIASKWSDSWLANYYAAFSIAVLSFDEKDKKKKEPMLNEADVFFEKMKTLNPSNEEVAILGALIASARIAANPSAYKKYGDIRDKYLATAKTLNQNNPRIYYLEGNATYYTPRMFGGGAKNALPFYEKAFALFNTEKKYDITHPYWGTYHNIYMMSLCKEELK